MPVRRFLVADAAAAAVWASGVVTIGYLGAGSIHQISSGLTEAGIVVVVAAAVTAYLVRHRRTRLTVATALPVGDASATPSPVMPVLEAPSRRALCPGRR